MRTRRLIPTLLLLLLALCPGRCAVLAQETGEGSSEKWLLVEVTDEGGRPLKSACVTFVPKEGEIIFRNADSRGHVKLKKPAAGSYRVVVKVEGYEAQKRVVTVGSRSETVAFSLQPRAN